MKRSMLASMMAMSLGMAPNAMPSMFTTRARISDRSMRSPECTAELKDKADLKRTRKNAKRVRDVLCGGWSASGYTVPFNRRVNLSARKA